MKKLINNLEIIKELMIENLIKVLQLLMYLHMDVLQSNWLIQVNKSLNMKQEMTKLVGFWNFEGEKFEAEIIFILKFTE